MPRNTLDIKPFGRSLIESLDLDPVYCMLVKARDTYLGRAQLFRFLVAYWCFYNVGFAAWASEYAGQAFWTALRTAARNTDDEPAPNGGRWPRGAERRHFRGEQATRPVAEMEARYGDFPENMVVACILGMDSTTDSLACMLNERPKVTCAEVFGHAKSHRGFGPWISFKVADMVDRLGLAEVSFDNSAIFMFDDPAKAAELAWAKYVGPVERSKHTVLERRDLVVADLIKTFSDLEAPPLGDRPINIQEVETVLCKWKSHCNGHYPLGNDTHEIHEGLQAWTPYSETARVFDEIVKKMPGLQLPGKY